uniref:Uncharacterized protein n=1 Tax=Parascaris univalens TaxID=6257 RepID=A0A915CHP6_PARUN
TFFTLDNYFQGVSLMKQEFLLSTDFSWLKSCHQAHYALFARISLLEITTRYPHATAAKRFFAALL